MSSETSTNDISDEEIQRIAQKKLNRKIKCQEAFQRWKAKQIESGTYKDTKEKYRIDYMRKKIMKIEQAS